MNEAPKLIYLLRKSKQEEDPATIPVLKRDDLPLRFFYKGREVNIEATPKGNLVIRETRLTGRNGKSPEA